MFIDRVENLLKEKNIFAKDMLADLEINKNQMARWKKENSIPKRTVLNAIADYLETTAEYLLGKTDIKEKAPGTGSINAENAFGTITMAVTKEEAEIIQAYRSYPEVGKKIVRRTLGLEGISPDAATAAYGGKDTQVGKMEE